MTSMAMKYQCCYGTFARDPHLQQASEEKKDLYTSSEKDSAESILEGIPMWNMMLLITNFVVLSTLLSTRQSNYEQRRTPIDHISRI